MADNFVHLHTHSEYSMLDALGKVNDLVARAAELGQPALALTDHGAMYGTIPFYQAAKRAGVRPIIGIEAYLAARRMQQRDKEKDRQRFHQLLLAQNQTGLANLFQIATAAQLEGFYYKPRIDMDFLAGHSEGLIATTGCLAGPVPRAIMRGDTNKMHEMMGWYVDVFGPDRFFIELQEHDIPELRQVNNTLLELMNTYGVRAVATNDVHYVNPGDGDTHDLLLCVQTGRLRRDENRMRMSGVMDYHLATCAEMEAKFGHVPGTLSNTLMVAEMCQVDLDPKGYHLPNFDVPEGYTADSYLRALCNKGLVEKYGVEALARDTGIRERLDYELEIINKMGFDTYFLIVWDMCQFAEREGIWWNVRGSGAGSVVAYTLNITDVEPISNALVFERFLNPHRVSMPDIDLDYPDDDRHRIAAYLRQKYGDDRVAQIITFGTLGAKAAIRDVGRSLDVPLPHVNRVSNLFPSMGKARIEEILDPADEVHNPELLSIYHNDPATRDLLDSAQALQGTIRHASTHAAGVIVSDRPLVEYVPLHRPTASKEGLGGITQVTQWPMEVVERQGLLKVDLLGLSTLTVMREAARLIKERHGVKYTKDNIPYQVAHIGPDPDKKAEKLFELLGSGRTMGVFQVESAGMRQVLTQMKPSRFAHIVAVLALYRPGPMQYIPLYIDRMHECEPVEYLHPDLKPILADTYGIIVYQEQIMQIASQLAGYSPGEADLMRRAVGKKKAEEIARHRQIFIDGCLNNGIDKETATAIYGDIEHFARYGFNKAHATDYAKVCCQTAFLKAHYPLEYMAALLSVERNKADKVVKFASEARQMGFDIKPPDINRSGREFSIEEAGDDRPVIRFGLGAIKNVGEEPISILLDAREKDGLFIDFLNLARRVNLKAMGKRPLEALIKAGVFDDWGARPQLLAIVDQVIRYSGTHNDAASVGQMSLFGRIDADDDILMPDADDVPALSSMEILQAEKECLGLYLSHHPLEDWEERVSAKVSATTDMVHHLHGRNVVLLGMIAHVKRHYTRNQQQMAFVTLEDMQGKLDLILFPDVWDRYQGIVQENNTLLVSGEAQAEGGKISMLVNSVLPVAEYSHAPDQRSHEIARHIERAARRNNAGALERAAPAESKTPVATASTPPASAHQYANHDDPAPGYVFFGLSPDCDWEWVVRTLVTGFPNALPGDNVIMIGVRGQDSHIEFPDRRVRYCPELVQHARNISGVLDVVFLSNGQDSAPSLQAS